MDFINAYMELSLRLLTPVSKMVHANAPFFGSPLGKMTRNVCLILMIIPWYIFSMPLFGILVAAHNRGAPKTRLNDHARGTTCST